MRHPDREIVDIHEIAGIFEKADTIRVGMNGGDYPYVVPVSFGWELVDGEIALYFHGARRGMKYDLLKRDPRVCVEADALRGYVPNGGSYTADYESAIGFGKAESLSGDAAVHGMRLLLRHCGVPEDCAGRCIQMDITEMTRVVLERVSGKRRFLRPVGQAR